MLSELKFPFNGSTYRFSYDEVLECPICKHAIKPINIHTYALFDANAKYKLSLQCQCMACNNTYIVQYVNVSLDAANNKQLFWGGNLDYISPNKYISEKFDDLIEKISPSFIKIYNQASSAESISLDEIAGIGFRKALEFLIKDFLIYKNPDKQDSIEKTQLGNCINNFIDNPQLKTAASRAVWLGNDQTHYIQKFNDKDISDLKRLIRLTVHWISMILETDEAATIEPMK